MYGALGNNTPVATQLKIFDSQIRPILEYGCEIWYTGKNIKSLETIQLQYLKRMLGVKTQTSDLAVYGETARYPLELRQIELQIRYWTRLISLDKSSPL